MNNKVGDIIIGTKVDNSGLQKGLKETKRELENFDKSKYNDVKITGPGFETKLSNKDKKRVQEIRKEIEQIEKLRHELYKKEEIGIITPEETAQLNDYVKQTEKLFDMWEKIEPLNYDNPQWSIKMESIMDPRQYRMLTGGVVDEYPKTKEAAELTQKILNMTDEERKLAREKRQEEVKTYEALKEQEAIESDLAQYNETINRLKRDNANLEFDIGIDESQFDDKLNNYKIKAELVANEIQKLFNKRTNLAENIALISQETNAFERQKSTMLEYARVYEELTNKKANGIELTENEQRTYNDLSKNIGNITEIKNEYDGLISKQTDYVEKLETTDLNLDKLTYNYNELIKKAKEYAGTSNGINAGNITKELEKIEKKTSSLLRKIGKWALALFSIRGAYSLITRSMSTLSDYNKTLATQLSNIRLVLAVGFEQIVNNILNLVVKLLNYINYLTKAWFGIDLFARAAELTTQKIADDMAGAAGSAKEMRKQLAGFDEMNVLGDNVGAAGGGGIGKANTPAFELDTNVPIPDWLKWIKDNGGTIATILGAIGTAMLAIKLAPFIAGLTGATTNMAAFTTGLGLMAGGIVLLVGEIINLVLNWDEMDNKQRAVAIGLAILGDAIFALGLSMATGFSAATFGIGLVVGAIVGLVTWVATLNEKHREEKKELQDVNYYQNQYNKAKEDAKKSIDDYVVSVKDAEEKQKLFDEAQAKCSKSAKELNEEILNGTIKYKDLSPELRDLWEKYRDNEAAQKDLTEKTKTMNEEIFNSQTAAALAEKDYKKYGDTLKKGMEDGIINSDKMSKKIVEDTKAMDNESKILFVENLPKEIKNAFDWNKYGSKLKTFKTNWNDYLGELEQKITIKAEIEYQIKEDPFNQKSNKYQITNRIGFAKGGIVNIPKLATGAIINQPGRGIPVSSAIAGEAGREGILPLTDIGAMAELGREIGKWVNINANIPVSIGNRQVGRIVEQLMAERDFVKNS